MNHTGGRKVSDSHSTYIDAVEPVLTFARRCKAVKRISLGRITPRLASAPQRIAVTHINGGLNLQVRGNTALQDIVLYTDSLDFVEKELRRELGRRFQINSTASKR